MPLKTEPSDALGFGDSDAQFGGGVAFGAKFPVADVASLKLEVPLTFLAESDYRIATFGGAVSFGVSVLLK